MQANPQQRVTPPNPPQIPPSTSQAPPRPPSLPSIPQQQQHSRTSSAQSGPSQQQSAAQPRPTLRDAVVSILANTANGCLHEVGFQKLQHANISQANVIETLKAENLALHKEWKRLNKFLGQPENEQARNYAELRAQVHQLSNHIQTLQRRIAELEPPPPSLHPPIEQPTVGDYHVLWQAYQVALQENQRLKPPITWHTAPGVQLQTLIVPSQGIANKVGRGPSSTASSSTSNSSVQHGRPTVVSDRRASDSAITRVSQGIQAHNGGEQIFQFPLGPPQSTMSMHRRHSSVIQTTPGHSPQAMQPPNPAFYITPGSSSQVMQSSPQAANSANAPGAQPFPYFQQPNSYHQQAPSQPVRYSKNPAKRPRLQQNESTPPMVSLSRAPPPMYAEASNSRQGPPIPNGQAAYPVSQPMAPPPHMIGRPNLPVQRLPDPVNATAVQNVPRSETPDLVGISMSLGTTQQVPRVLSAPNMSSSASSISPASSVRPPSPPVRESARPSEEPTGHLSTSPLAQYVNVARSSAPSPQVATGLPHQSPTSSIDTQATDAIGGGGATPHEAMTPAPIHQTIIEEANESSAGDHQVDEIMMDYSHTTDDIKESSDVGVVADSLPPVEADADMDMPLAHDENVDEDEEEDEDDNWADLTDDEAGDRRPVIECVSSVFFDAADEERYCQLCNLRVETKLMEVAPTFSESGMRDLVRHLKEEHPAAWLKLRSREDSTKTEPTPS